MDGSELRAFRKERKLTQQALADHLGLGLNTIRRYENNEWPVSRLLELWIQGEKPK